MNITFKDIYDLPNFARAGDFELDYGYDSRVDTASDKDAHDFCLTVQKIQLNMVKNTIIVHHIGTLGENLNRLKKFNYINRILLKNSIMTIFKVNLIDHSTIFDYSQVGALFHIFTFAIKD